LLIVSRTIDASIPMIEYIMIPVLLDAKNLCHILPQKQARKKSRPLNLCFRGIRTGCFAFA
jgi:hypothetical protein